MMDFINKSLASFGIGSATVDTRLSQERFQPGEMVKGEVHIRGGGAEQRIDDIYLYLMATATRGNQKSPLVLKEYRLSKSFVIQPDETRVIPFEIRLPLETPMSTGSYPVYLKTGLDIKMARDPGDTDRIEIFPTPLVQKLLKQIEDSGFLLYQIHNEHDPDMKPIPLFQMFVFRPTGRYHGYVDEIRVSFQLTDHDIRMDVETVRADRLIHSSFEWEYHNPNGTLRINGVAVEEDPLMKIQEMLSRRGTIPPQ
ncbi:sporulation protein [Staphylospora marina]|uniref:sporulation protein n=1 Tax=Staphylospora marina TaxID=2490858 RepID=UPI000F5B8F11|nr:sporulation protein [Staphylospora marina]